MKEKYPLLKGEKYGALTVICLDHTKKFFNNGLKYYYKCQCDCGNTCVVEKLYLKTGLISCCKNLPSNQHETIIRLRRCLANMIYRCYNTNSTSYKDYGGRGIKVCDEWKNDFLAFYHWAINNGYQDNLTIDRIDVNGNYEPDNCRWVDGYIQAGNKRNNHLLTYKGKTQCLDAWAREYNLNRKFLENRINNFKMTIEEALTKPTNYRYIFLTYKNETKNAKEWSKIINTSSYSIRRLAKEGWSAEDLIKKFGYR